MKVDQKLAEYWIDATSEIYNGVHHRLGRRYKHVLPVQFQPPFSLLDKYKFITPYSGHGTEDHKLNQNYKLETDRTNNKQTMSYLVVIIFVVPLDGQLAALPGNEHLES